MNFRFGESLFLRAVLVAILPWYAIIAQTIYVPASDPVYNFLEHSHLRGLSSYSEVSIPISRMEAAKYLLQIENHDEILTKVEKGELQYFEQEYSIELLKLQGRSDFDSTSTHLYHYNDSTFRLELDPRLGGILADGVQRSWIGLQFFGSIAQHLGFDFSFEDNTEQGSNVTFNTKYTAVQSKNIVWAQDGQYDYSYLRCNITADFDWFRFGIGQDNIQWGSGYRSKLILSSKPLPYPYLRMEFRPTDWLHLYYIHGWLKSNVLDSLATYESQVAGMPRNIYREKYIAAHILDIRPSMNWEITLGESIIYSDYSPQLIFLIPINFFRAADHYLTNSANGDGNNSQFFSDIQYWGIKNVKLYNTIFIDEIDINNIFNPGKSRNQLGSTFGTRFTGFPSADFDWTIEYTIILPWVYSNFVQTQTYTSDGDLLGDYIGDNSDQIYSEINWRPASAIRITAYVDYVRKGGQADIAKEYELPSLPFLYGNIAYRSFGGGFVEYYPYHNILVRADLTLGDVQYSGENSNWKLTARYGF